jgi:hypothetical protein
MPSDKRNWTSGYQAVFFWTGVAMTLACIGLVLAGNTELFYRVERANFPLSWACAGVAMLQFTGAEICHHADAVKRRSGKGRSEQRAVGRSAIEAQGQA